MVKFFTLSLSDPTPILSYARSNNILHKIPFFHLVQYCMFKTEVEISKVHILLSSPTCIWYTFGI